MMYVMSLFFIRTIFAGSWSHCWDLPPGETKRACMHNVVTDDIASSMNITPEEFRRRRMEDDGPLIRWDRLQQSEDNNLDGNNSGVMSFSSGTIDVLVRPDNGEVFEHMWSAKLRDGASVDAKEWCNSLEEHLGYLSDIYHCTPETKSRNDEFIDMPVNMRELYSILVSQNWVGLKDIEFLEPDNLVGTFDSSPNDECGSSRNVEGYWNLDAVDGDFDDQLYQESDEKGKDVHIWVLDTGVQVDHPEFQGRMDQSRGPSGYSGSHGTHCAGTAGGSNAGAAPEATLHSYRSCCGGGLNVRDGILESIKYAKENSGSKNLCTISIGYCDTCSNGLGQRSCCGGSFNQDKRQPNGPSDIMNQAAKDAEAAGVGIVLAAGNSNSDSAPYVLTNTQSVVLVGATDHKNRRASFSNYGSDIDIWAPGTHIRSSVIGGHYSKMSGTSMATPLVAGVLASMWGAGNSGECDISFKNAREKLYAHSRSIDIHEGSTKRYLHKPRLTSWFTECPHRCHASEGWIHLDGACRFPGWKAKFAGYVTPAACRKACANEELCVSYDLQFAAKAECHLFYHKDGDFVDASDFETGNGAEECYVKDRTRAPTYSPTSVPTPAPTRPPTPKPTSTPKPTTKLDKCVDNCLGKLREANKCTARVNCNQKCASACQAYMKVSRFVDEDAYLNNWIFWNSWRW